MHRTRTTNILSGQPLAYFCWLGCGPFAIEETHKLGGPKDSVIASRLFRVRSQNHRQRMVLELAWYAHLPISLFLKRELVISDNKATLGQNRFNSTSALP